MVKRALCVGCDYPSKNPGLSGAVNDCFLLADCLHRSCGFQPEDICILHDVIPGQAKSSERLVDPSRRPTRANILHRLRWLARGAKPGDVLFFSFSGYGLQVDDLRCSQGEGFDEAILPTDFEHGLDGESAVITTGEIHDALMGIPQGCSLTVVMDCDHGTSVVDVSGTLDGQLVPGLKKNLCGASSTNTKMQLSDHDKDVWEEGSGPSVGAQPRFQPLIELANPGSGKVPTRQLMSRSTPVAFCYSAAGHGETAVELQVAGSSHGWDVLKQHGALSWCFVKALEELQCDCTHAELQVGINKHMGRLKEECLPRMDQQVLLTFSLPLSNPRLEKVLRPTASGEYHRDMARSSQSFPSRVENMAARQRSAGIVPPPPPGFLGRASSCAVPLEAGFLPSPLASMGLSVWRAAWSGALGAGDSPSGQDVPGEQLPEHIPAAPVSGASASLAREAERRFDVEFRASAPACGSNELPRAAQSAPAQSPWPAPVPAVNKSESASTCSTCSQDYQAHAGSGSDSDDEDSYDLGGLLPAGVGEWARRVFSFPRHQERGGSNHGLCPLPNGGHCLMPTAKQRSAW